MSWSPEPKGALGHPLLSGLSILCSQLLILRHTDCISAQILENIQFPKEQDAHNEINYGFFSA